MAFTAKDIKVGLRYERKSMGYRGIITFVPSGPLGFIERKIEYSNSVYSGCGKIGLLCSVRVFVEYLESGEIEIIQNGFIRALMKWKELNLQNAP